MNIRRAAVVVGLVLFVSVAGLLGAGWYYSDQLRDGALVVDHTPPQLDLEVVAIEEGRVTLRMTLDAEADGPWTKEGIWGLERDGGYAQVGAILEINDQEVVRELLFSTSDLSIGDLVRLDSFAFADDPWTALGIPFEEVSYTSPLGDCPAWFVDGSRSTWAIFVHGRGASGEEALRMLPTVVEVGFPSLIISYRTDADAPSSPDGFYRFGVTEWQDLEAAAGYALEQGADDLLLVGYSMGGGIVASFLYQSPLSERVRGVILDAPMLNFGATVDFGARQRGYPGLLTALGKFIAGVRFGIQWGEPDYLSRASELAVPILLLQGDADDVVPPETSDALAEARPGTVEYVRVAGATHVRSWNMDPAAYQEAVHGFLQELAGE